MKLTFIFFLILFLINSSSANINITVQSENNKTISIVDLRNFSTVANGTNNQTFSNLSYSNYEVRILSDTSLTVSDTVNFFEGNYSKMVYLALIVLIIFFIIYLIKGLSK